jgi:hypothetical protein
LSFSRDCEKCQFGNHLKPRRGGGRRTVSRLVGYDCGDKQVKVCRRESHHSFVMS